MDGFEKAAEALTQYTKDTLVQFDLEIEAKKEELNRLNEEYQHSLTKLKTETDLTLAAYRYEGARKILSERNEVPISADELSALRANVARLTSERDKEVQNAIKNERDRADNEMKSAVSMRDLNHKAQTAELTATCNQQLKEIESLKNTIANLKDEVAQQRKLTEAVANAGRAAPVTVQTTGK
jgi:HAMP domain-containing protein